MERYEELEIFSRGKRHFLSQLEVQETTNIYTFFFFKKKGNFALTSLLLVRKRETGQNCALVLKSPFNMLDGLICDSCLNTSYKLCFSQANFGLK